MGASPIAARGRSSALSALARLMFAMGAACALLAGCALTRGLSPQASLERADALAAQQSLSGTAFSPAAWPALDWWKRYQDRQLDQLIDEAFSGSPNLRIAAARARQASAFAAVNAAALAPQVNLDGASTRERFSAHSLYPPPFAGAWETFNQLRLTANYELDLWGKNRAAYESALGEARAAEIDAFAARLALASAVAQAYIELQRAFAQQDVARQVLRERERILSLSRERHLAGIDSELPLRQAEAGLPGSREQIIQLDETIALGRNELAALLGKGPDRGLAITPGALEALEPVKLPSSIPAELLGRRPDIVAQRWRVESASRDIAAAKAQFYPNVSLSAFVGYEEIGTTAVLQSANRTMGAGPALSLPIFDAGRLRGNLAERDAAYDAAVEQYNQTLVAALREVVDSLSSLRSIEQQRREQREALHTTGLSYDLATQRFRDGIGNYLDVLSAEAPLLAQRSLDVDLRARELSLSVNLARALGGGFEDASAAPAP